MVNSEAAALQEAQVILHKASIVMEARLLKSASVTGALRRYADENDIGLTVMGAYGHSRLRRFFIGSHTPEMLAESRQPLLMLR
ncbi:universal stress protein [Pantoea sp. Lu_F5_004]|uniref:universal stress protein n=1 Tax=Pantoea sp. Lu_F5_004 TaxID=3443507 RepID=UPI0038A59B13